jgi:hypothetical protein
MEMKIYEVRKNSGWNWNHRGAWCVVAHGWGIIASYMSKDDADAVAKELNDAEM